VGLFYIFRVLFSRKKNRFFSAILGDFKGTPSRYRKLGPESSFHIHYVPEIKPLEKFQRLGNIRALRQEDIHPRVLAGIITIRQQFGCLIEIDVTGITPGRADNDVGLSFDFSTEDLIHELGGLDPCRCPVASIEAGDLTRLIGEHIKEHNGLDKGAHVSQVVMGRIDECRY